MKVMRYSCQAVFAGAIFALIGRPIASQAATANVLVGSGGDHFVPAVTNINVNDQVIWSWAGNNHSSTSGTVSGGTAQPDGLWNSGVHNMPFSFTNQFTSAGTFPYFCSIHFNVGMTGAVVVASANLPPTVSITNPALNTVFAAPANVTIQASASDSDGTVTNVQFLVGVTSLGNVTTPPYSAVASSLAAGNYTLFAIASDNGGLMATSSVPISVVTPGSIVLSAPVLQPPADFHFSYTANTGLTYVIQRSTNIASSSWISLGTNVAGSSSVTYTDLNATVKPGFYRVGRLPNP